MALLRLIIHASRCSVVIAPCCCQASAGLLSGLCRAVTGPSPDLCRTSAGPPGSGAVSGRTSGNGSGEAVGGATGKACPYLRLLHMQCTAVLLGQAIAQVHVRDSQEEVLLMFGLRAAGGDGTAGGPRTYVAVAKSRIMRARAQLCFARRWTSSNFSVRLVLVLCSRSSPRS